MSILFSQTFFENPENAMATKLQVICTCVESGTIATVYAEVADSAYTKSTC